MIFSFFTEKQMNFTVQKSVDDQQEEVAINRSSKTEQKLDNRKANRKQQEKLVLCSEQEETNSNKK
jgi:hypothetical protein